MLTASPLPSRTIRRILIKNLLHAIVWIEQHVEKMPFKRENLKNSFREIKIFSRQRPLHSAFFGVAALMVVVVAAFLIFIHLPGNREHNIHFIAHKGSNWNVAGDLHRAEIISQPMLFRAAVFMLAQRGLRAGEYIIRADDSYRNIIHSMQSGNHKRYKFTIPEGQTNYQIRKALEIHVLLTGEVGILPAEGTLLPETYLAYFKKQRTHIVRQMHYEHNRLVKKLWEARTNSLPLNSVKEVVILASIVEKETGIDGERRHIAGVFMNRLNKDSYMQLQSDPTVIYALTKGKPFKRSLIYQDLKIDDPYNTYRNYGLPPGAITNPGRAALKAVLDPLPTKDLYFVADGTGGHAFAENYEAHLENVKKWRVVQNGGTREEK